MTFYRVPMLALVIAPLFLTACGVAPAPSPQDPVERESPRQVQRRAATGPIEKPVPPLKLSVPAPLSAELDGQNLKKMEADELHGRANQAMSKGDYPRAAAYQYWYVQKSQMGQYNLAFFLAQLGQTDAAFYWLQRAALDEGVDSTYAQRDGDFDSLRADSRWVKVRTFLEDCNTYFETAPISRTVVLLPKGYQKGTPIPAVLWLHGMGSRPEDFANDDAQSYADELKIAIIGVSGTKARGPRSFVWAEDIEADAKRLREAIAEASEKVTLQKGNLITLGFSQGAQMGLEVAVKYPEDYAGAIVLSPGASSHLSELSPSPLLSQRGYVLCCGAQEHPGNVSLTSADANWLRRAKAQVIHKAYPGVSAHTFPQDFDERFPEWIKFILKARNG